MTNEERIIDAKEKLNFKDIQNKIMEYIKLNKEKIPEFYTKKDILKEVQIDNKIKKQNLIGIKAFKTAKAFYYYNPELCENIKLNKLENNLYVNYGSNKIIERIPVSETYYLKYENLTEYLQEIDKIFINNNDKANTVVLIFFINEENYKKTLIEYMLTYHTKKDVHVSCVYKFINY